MQDIYLYLLYYKQWASTNQNHLLSIQDQLRFEGAHFRYNHYSSDLGSGSQLNDVIMT